MRDIGTTHFEATPDADPGLVFNPDMPPPAVDDVAPEPEAAEPDLAAQLQSLQDTIGQQQQMLQSLAPVAEYLQGAPGPDQFGQEQQSEIDLFSDDPTEQIRRLIREETAPYAQVMQQRQLEDLESSARDMIADVEASKGELLRPQYEEGQEGLTPQDLVLEIAKNYSPMMVQQYGEGVRADEAAIEQAYEDVKGLQSALLAAAEARDQNQIATLAGAPSDPGSSGISAPTAVSTAPGGWDAFKARQGLS